LAGEETSFVFMVKLVAMRFLNIQQLEITQYTQPLKAHHVLEAKVFPRPFFSHRTVFYLISSWILAQTPKLGWLYFFFRAAALFASSKLEAPLHFFFPGSK